MKQDPKSIPPVGARVVAYQADGTPYVSGKLVRSSVHPASGTLMHYIRRDDGLDPSAVFITPAVIRESDEVLAKPRRIKNYHRPIRPVTPEQIRADLAKYDEVQINGVRVTDPKDVAKLQSPGARVAPAVPREPREPREPETSVGDILADVATAAGNLD